MTLGLAACGPESSVSDESAGAPETTATPRRTTSAPRSPLASEEVPCPSGSVDFTHDSFEFEAGPYAGDEFSTWVVEATGTITNRSEVNALLFLFAQIESIGGLRADAALLLYTPDGNSAGSELKPGEQFVYSVLAPAVAFNRFGESVKDDEPARLIIDASRSLWFAPLHCPVQTRGL